MQNRPTENQARINELARLIDELSTELSERLNIEEDTTQDNNREVRREIIIGDIVEITNSYRNQLGERGTVTRITRSQVLIDLHSTGRNIRKSKRNVRIVSSQSSNTEK